VEQTDGHNFHKGLLKNHTQRVLTAFFLIPLILFVLLIQEKWPFQVTVLVISQIALFELLQMNIKNQAFYRILGHLVSLAVIFCFFLRQLMLLPLLVFLPLMVLAIKNLRTKVISLQQLTDLGQLMFSIIYISVPFGLLLILEMLPNGRLWIIFLMVGVFFGDAAAYYVGKGFGRHLLIPVISPKKTWEGAVGGLMGTLLGCNLFLNAFKIHKLGWETVVLSISIAICAQVGDLFESWIKRVYNQKDSGRILPGHGGMLDRIDGFIFAVPLLYAFLHLKMGF